MVDHSKEGQGHPNRQLLKTTNKNRIRILLTRLLHHIYHLVHFDRVTFLVDAAQKDGRDLEEVVNLE